MKKAFGFTLAEIMIVLSVIGILTAVLLPIVANSTPDKNVMKFKKADTTLKNVIHELVTSDKYYCEGDLGYKADCKTRNTILTGAIYFCQTVADLLSTKKVNCYSTDSGADARGNRLLSNECMFEFQPCPFTRVIRQVDSSTIKATKEFFDTDCKENAKIFGAEITTTDNIVYYQTSTNLGFGVALCTVENRFFSPPNQFPANYSDQNGFDINYKTYCIDIDGFNETDGSDNCDDVKDICPFGYGIRADGKILPGARADAWLAKDFQGKDPSEQE